MPDYGRYRHLLVEKGDDGVVVVTLNRPEVLNAVNVALHTELEEIFVDVVKEGR